MARIDDFTIDEKIDYIKNVNKIVNTYKDRITAISINDISTEIKLNADIGEIELTIYKDNNVMIVIGNKNDCRDWESHKLKISCTSFYDDWIYCDNKDRNISFSIKFDIKNTDTIL